MIINNTLQGIASVYSKNNSTSKAAKAYQQERDEQDDIQISTKGQQFNDLLQKLKSGSEVRTDKVVYYENLVASGSYFVSSQDLADKILQTRY